MMMEHSSVGIGIAALLSVSALGYFVCLRANAEKKGSSLKTVGLALGAVITIVSLALALTGTVKVAFIMYKKCSMMKHGCMMGKMGQMDKMDKGAACGAHSQQPQN